MTALLGLLLYGGHAHAETVRFGLFVGNNRGFGGDVELSSAEREARDLAGVFQEIGGLSRDRTVVLQGTTVDELLEAIRSTEAQIREAEARGDDAMLLFYYSGHGSRAGLHLNGELLPMETLERWLQTSAAQARLAFVDACESGALARLKGGTPVEAVDLHLDDALMAYGYAVLTSTGPQEVARESEAFGGGVFSRSLLTGLRGAADRDEDGGVSLEEVYDHVFRETVRGTVAGGRGIQRPELHAALTGVGQVVLTRVADRAAGLVLPVELEGTYTVVSVSTGGVVAQLSKKAGQHRRVALPAGRYFVRKVRRSDVLVAELDLAWGGDRWVDDAQMRSVPLGDPMSRGSGPFDRPVRVFAVGLATTPMSAANPVGSGGEIGLRWRGRGSLGVTLAASVDQGRKEAIIGRLQASTQRVRAGVFVQGHRRRLDVYGAAGGAVLALHQFLQTNDDDRRPEFTNVATQYTGGLFGEGGLHIPFGPAVGLTVGTVATLYPVQTDEVQAFFVRAEGRAGLAARFGGHSARLRRTER